MQRSWQTENKLAATQYPLVTRLFRVAVGIKTQGRLPNPDPTSTLAGHPCTSNRFAQKEPFPPCYAADFSYRAPSAPSCTEPRRLSERHMFANRFPHQIDVDQGGTASRASRDAKEPANFSVDPSDSIRRHADSVRPPRKAPAEFAVNGTRHSQKPLGDIPR